MNKGRWSAFLANTEIIVVALLAGGAIVVVVAEHIGWDLPRNELISIVLVLLALLTLAFVHERARTAQSFRSLTQLMAQSIGGQYIEGRSEISALVTDLVQRAEYTIDAYISSADLYLFHEWCATIAQTLQNTNRQGRGVELDIVITVNLKRLPVNFANDIATNYGTFEEYDVDSQVKCCLLDMDPPIGIDLFVIDRRHVFMGPTPIDKTLFNGSVLFENQPGIGQEMSMWITKVKEAYHCTKYSDWRKNHGYHNKSDDLLTKLKHAFIM